MSLILGHDLVFLLAATHFSLKPDPATAITVNGASDHFIFRDLHVGSILGEWANCIGPRATF